MQLTIPGLVENAPTITDFGATAGQGKQQTLTVNRTQLPITITMSATLADTTSWSLMRVTGAGAVEAASSPSPATSMLYPEALTSTFHPPATWSLSQSGFHLTNLPSARHAAPSQSPQRVCTVQRPGQSTTLTLTGTNEAGTATRSVTIQWAGGSSATAGGMLCCGSNALVGLPPRAAGDETRRHQGARSPARRGWSASRYQGRRFPSLLGVVPSPSGRAGYGIMYGGFTALHSPGNAARETCHDRIRGCQPRRPRSRATGNAMNAATFDTYAAAKRLRDAGFDERQAEAAVSMVRDAAGADREQLATKADLRADLAGLETRLRADLATKADLETLRSELRWMLAFQAALILAIAAKLFGIV